MNRLLPVSAPKRSDTAVVVLSVVLAGVWPAIAPGCGPAAPEVDKAALYTPESLATELAFRFQELSPDARTAKSTFKPKPDKSLAERLARAEQAKSKGSGGAAAKKKQTAPHSIDDLLADIDSKLNVIAGVSRSEACRKMVEQVSRDQSLSADAKQRLTELVGQLSGAP
jgi:hypothetical protein